MDRIPKAFVGAHEFAGRLGRGSSRSRFVSVERTRRPVTQGLHLVRARQSDLSPYIDLLEAIAEWLAVRGVRQYAPGAFRASRLYFSESIERGEVHWASIDDARVGAVRLLKEDSIAWPDVRDGEAIYVNNLVVHRDWGHRGVGLRILEWAKREARAMGKVFLRLDCVADNQFLRRYYADAGFLDRGEIEARYPDPFGTMRLQRYERRLRRDPDAGL